MGNPLRITKGEAAVGAMQIGTGDMVYGTDAGTVEIGRAHV